MSYWKTKSAFSYFLRCPDCKLKRLEPIDYQGVEIDVCKKCGGLWFDHDELQQVIKNYDSAYDPEEQDPAINQGETNCLCPRCSVKLNKMNYSEGVGVDYDLCTSCRGIWLEHDQFAMAKDAHRATALNRRLREKPGLSSWVFQFFTRLPVEFNIKPKQPPLVTLGLIVFNVMMFLLSSAFGLAESIGELGFTPVNFGVTELDNLFSSLFMHASFGHLLGNMYFLYILGDNVEEAMGHIKYFVFYLLCGLGANLIHGAASNLGEIPIIGASGAVAGIMGAYLFLFRRAKLTFMLLFFFQIKVSARWWLGIWAAFNAFMAIFEFGNVAWWAHIGGFAIGVLFAMIDYENVLKRLPILRIMNSQLPHR